MRIDPFISLMVIVMTATGKAIENMEKVFILGLTVINIKETSLIMK